MDYAQRTIHIIAQESPDLQGISSLEEKLSTAKEEVGTLQSRGSQQTLLENMGDNMEEISERNNKESLNLWSGILTGIASLMYLNYPRTRKRKEN
ncbi:hypothetical protein HY496_02275 [Candidatus Woesearchaeota archaeon]|nr:hypothetical protein [Candidatus Woesearchaeota archaeon]